VGGACTKQTEGDAWVGEAKVADYVQNVTVVALDEKKLPVTWHTVVAPGAATTLQLSVDVPSPATGTGSRLILDGNDAGLIRAALVDDNGRLVPDATANVTFSVIVGNGRVLGIGNGNPASHKFQPGNVTDTYGGLARVIVQVSTDCLSKNRQVMDQVNWDEGAKQRTLVDQSGNCHTLLPIVVQADAPGFDSAQVRIDVSAVPELDSPQAIAASTVPMETFSYFEDFDG